MNLTSEVGNYYLNLQDAWSEIHSKAFAFHELILILITFIFLFVAYMGIRVLTARSTARTMTDNQLLELIWTVLPMLILLGLAVPSLDLLYQLDENAGAKSATKVLGHQWYWTYEQGAQEWSGYLCPTLPRNLLCDSNLQLLAEPQTVLVSSTDVIHSWAVPALSCKADAVPGRINQSLISPVKTGVMYGQCSEICGANHSFMPISVEVNAV